MKICVVGKGGREHVLAETLSKSPSNPEVYAFPGSDGMAAVAKPVEADGMEGLIDWMKAHEIDLCVAGEESYLAKGLADQCKEAGIRAWGPIQKSAMLESSKIFAKSFMNRHHIPTGGCDVVESPEQLREVVTSLPCVLKYDGLAAGKGVAVCFEEAQVEAFIKDVFDDQKFGQGQVLVEEFLEGKEVSIIAAVANGKCQIFTPARDYKRQLDGDGGPNTGGMGAVASRALISDELLAEIDEKIIQPTVEGLVSDALDYRGFLYFGVMLTKDGPKILEYNVRFGDPEAQAILPLVGGDFATFLYDAANCELKGETLAFDKRWSVCLVLASGDYPYSGGSGEVITGLDAVENAHVYHAGTVKNEAGEFENNGGRVLAVVCTGDSREEAVKAAYGELAKVTFNGAQNRTDIGTLHFED